MLETPMKIPNSCVTSCSIRAHRCMPDIVAKNCCLLVETQELVWTYQSWCNCLRCRILFVLTLPREIVEGLTRGHVQICTCNVNVSHFSVDICGAFRFQHCIEIFGELFNNERVQNAGSGRVRAGRIAGRQCSGRFHVRGHHSSRGSNRIHSGVLFPQQRVTDV